VKARAEDGFTMIMTVIGITLIVLLAAVAVTAVNGDTALSGHDLSRKQAYEAALAGINEYAFHLHAEPNYWEKCTEAVPKGQPTALNQEGSTKNKRPVPGQPSASYALELLPAEGHASCDGSSLTAATTSFIEPANGGPLGGTFRVRATGFAGESQVKVTATFKPASFLDYVYFTQRETSDPVTYGKEVLINSATVQCSKKISEHRTESPLTNEKGEVLGELGEVLHKKNGKYYNSEQPEKEKSPEYCDTISFVSGDNIQGPMRTNDVFVLCGSPILGRNSGDPIIVSYPTAPGWLSTSNSMLHSGSSCGGSEKNIKGHYLYGQGDLIPPKSNQELKKIAEEGGYLFEGELNICLEGSQMKIGHGKQCEGETKPYPPNGVIYVSTLECPNSYTPFGVEYATTATGKCGTVNVQGTFSKPLTIAAQNDILITGNLKKANEEGMLGLIANNFIRVKHPVAVETKTRTEKGVTVTEKTCKPTSTNLEGTIEEPTIEAALLALEHSFIVDNYSCGAKLKNLNVTGAIAQYYRGAVGTTETSGYLKNYVYDQRFERTEPPHFLEPVKSDWVIGRETTD
jgi:hypothetical protein